ncbi:MAG: helix-hairpin-helix domain-containing protein [Asgard group archaeon]|nr:helix-hairpin-helix domain-containing protein [Asgard group archaeon]
MSSRPTRRSLIGSYRFSVIIKPEEKEFSDAMNGSLDLLDGKHVIETHKFSSFDQLATTIINFWEKMLGTEVNVHRFSNWLSEYFSDIGITDVNFYQLLETVRSLGQGVALHSSGLKIREAKVIRDPLEPSKPKGLPAEIADGPVDTLVKPSEITKPTEISSPIKTTLQPVKREVKEVEPKEAPPDDTLLKPSETLQKKETVFDIDEDYIPTFKTISGDPIVTSPKETSTLDEPVSESLLRPSEYLKKRDTIEIISGELRTPSQVQEDRVKDTLEQEKKTRILGKIVKNQKLLPPSESLLKQSEYLKEKELIDSFEVHHLQKPSEVLKGKETIKTVPVKKIDPEVDVIPIPYEVKPSKKKEEEPVKKESELPFEIEIIEDEEGEKEVFKVTDIMGVGARTAMMLSDMGYARIDDIVDANLEEVSKVPGVGITTAKKIIYGARALKSLSEDVKKESESQTEVEEIKSEEVEKTQFKLTDIVGVGAKTAMLLKDKGFTSVDEIISTSPEEISKVPGISIAAAKKIIDGARALKSKSEEK